MIIAAAPPKRVRDSTTPLRRIAKRRDCSMTMKDAAGFIRANTKLLAPPLVPEIVLHLAEELLPIWQKTEEELGEMNVPPPYWAFAWAGGQALAATSSIIRVSSRSSGARSGDRFRPAGHRRQEGWGVGPCRRYRRGRPCGHHPQRRRQRRVCGIDRRGFAGCRAQVLRRGARR